MKARKACNCIYLINLNMMSRSTGNGVKNSISMQSLCKRSVEVELVGVLRKIGVVVYSDDGTGLEEMSNANSRIFWDNGILPSFIFQRPYS